MIRFFITFFFIFKLVYSQTNVSIISDIEKNSLIEKGREAYFTKDIENLISITEKVNSLYKRSKDSILLAKYFHFKALQCKLTYTNDSAFYYYHRSKNISKIIKDSLATGRRLLSLAILQKETKDFLGSEVSSIEALQYLEAMTYDIGKANVYIERVYNNLGLVADGLNQEEEALEHYDKALEINKKLNNNEGYLYILNNIGLLYQHTGNHKKGIEYFLRGLAFDSIQEKYPIQYALLLENLTFSQYKSKKKIFTLQRYEEVLEIRKKYKVDIELPTTEINIANIYKDKNNIVKAKFHADRALEYAKKTNNNKRWLDALQLLSKLNTGKQSRAYLEEYIALNDSLFQQERQLKNQFAKIRYETGKTEKENDLLKTENEKKQTEILYHKQQTTIGWLVSAISILFLITSISFFIFRRKRMLFQAKLQKAEAREQERKRIAKSLHDEVAGDLRLLHRKLEKSELVEEAKKLELVKDNVRNLSHQLSSVSFDDVNFTDQIINLVSDYFAPDFIIRVNGLKEIDWTQTNKSIKRLLYLSLRECIQNCQKYAQASKMTICFSIHKKSVLLDVVDNGVGFDMSTQKKGIGLLNLQERVNELSGTLTIESEIGKGTKTNIQIPLNA